MPEIPQAWAELIEGLQLMAAHAANDHRPLHCEHDELWVMADPAEFTDEERARLDALGFFDGGDDAFHSFRFGSA